MKRQEILDILKAVRPGIANKEIIEHTTSFIFKDKRVFTYNDEVMISHPIDLSIKGAVPAKELYSLLSNIKTDSISIKQDDKELYINGKNFKAGITLTKKITLPINKLKLSNSWTKLSKRFCEGVKFCLFSTGTDYSNLILTHIHVGIGIVESSDNYRLTRFNSKDIKSKMLIPILAAKELIKYNPTHYQKTKGWIHCKNKEDVIFSFRTSDTKYPDTSSILEMKDAINIKFPSLLINSLNNAESVCKEEISGDKFVKVNINGKIMTIRGEGDLGWYKETFKLKKSYSNIKFEINSKSFKDILSHLKKASVSKNKMKFEGEDFIHVIVLLKGE